MYALKFAMLGLQIELRHDLEIHLEKIPRHVESAFQPDHPAGLQVDVIRLVRRHERSIFQVEMTVIPVGQEIGVAVGIMWA